MSLGVYCIKSPNNENDPAFLQMCNTFLGGISRSLGEELYLADEKTFIEQHTHIIFVGSGGSEQQFAGMYRKVKGPYYLLTHPTHNSLAAAMEILAFLRENGEKGEIIHGDFATIGKKVAGIIKVNAVRERLKGLRLGTTGESTWLIASKVDPAVMKATSGMELVSIPMKELLAEAAMNKYEDNKFTEEIKSKGYVSEDIERALGVYGAVRRLVDRYQLNGVTITCFDLLKPACISGCLALAILNAEGIHAACEGDGRSLVSMTVLRELTGLPVFMANPGRLFPEKNEMVFAHCVLPLNMPERYQLTTHFESGLGVSIAAELPLGDCTVFKCKEDFKEYYAQNGEILENLHEGCMCRTQIRIHLLENMSYFMTQPIANHHMICIGDHKALLDSFFASYRS
jgi:L-fucose isomerase-like protein